MNNRHICIIQNEEDFSEKATYYFTYARLILFAFLIFMLVLALSFYLINTSLARWFDPCYAERETRKDLVEMQVVLDSISGQLENQIQYTKNLNMILAGGVQDSLQEASAHAAAVKLTKNEEALMIDSLFKSEFETSGSEFLPGQSLENFSLRETYFFSPISGFISDPFAPKNGHYGIDVVSKKDEPVKCIADGTVIFAFWTREAGNVIGVQHQGNLISVYKHQSSLTRELGEFVSAGEIIGLVGNTGELTTGAHLHFELWHNGNAINPEEFISF